MSHSFVIRKLSLGIALTLSAVTWQTALAASTCPFDGGGSDAVNDGVVLTRYALGITGTPLVASTRYASLDPLQVKNNIECVGCALDMNGDGQIDTVDTTIIARHLTGFSGTALTNGLALGSAPGASRTTTAAISSFLASGCATGGAINAWTQGGNAFGVPGVMGTTDAQPLTVQSAGASANLFVAGGNGLRVQVSGATLSAPNVINGSNANQITSGVRGATIAGGGVNLDDPFYAGADGNRVVDAYGTVGGGYSNRAGTLSGAPLTSTASTVAGGYANVAEGFASVVAGGTQNKASGTFAAAGGGFNNQASGFNSSVLGGQSNTASGTFSVVAGGGGNTASAHGSFIGGGGYCCSGNETTPYPNTVTARGGSIVGGYQNTVDGEASFIGGGFLNKVIGGGASYAASVVGGQGNTASAAYSVVSGGSNNTANAPYSSITGGVGAATKLHGQTASAAGSFSGALGTAQATQYVLRNRTTDATPTTLFLDGNIALLQFEPGRAGLMDIQVIAFAEGTGFTAAYSFQCAYVVVTGGAALQPNGCGKVIVNESEPSWDANVSFHPGGSALGIRVTGISGRSIRWVATVRATEVSTE